MKRIATLLLLAFTLGACSSSNPSSDPQAVNSNGDNSSVSLEAYCALALEAESLSGEFAKFNPAEPDSMRQLFERVKDIFTRILPTVPAEVRADLEMGQTVFLGIIAEFEAVDYDYTKIDEEVQQRIAALTSDPEVKAATDRLEAFDQAKCGIKAEASN